MKGHLLDTNIILIAQTKPEALSRAARGAITHGPVIVSAVSYWEVLLKSQKGNLDVGDPRAWWPETLDQLAATPLPIYPRHLDVLIPLPPIHKDPFDRLLIAQAISEDLDLVTTDDVIRRYAKAGCRVVL